MQPMDQEPEVWKGHDRDDEAYGNYNFSKEEYLKEFEEKVLRDHPQFSREVLLEFKVFYNLWERELERVEQLSEQNAHKRLIHYLKGH